MYWKSHRSLQYLQKLNGDAIDKGNYIQAAISILSPFSKVLERLIHNQLYDFLEKHSIL